MLAYVADILMCCFWILAYLFIVIGTIKHQKKIVNPIATLLTSSIEIGFLANVIVPGGGI